MCDTLCHVLGALGNSPRTAQVAKYGKTPAHRGHLETKTNERKTMLIKHTVTIRATGLDRGTLVEVEQTIKPGTLAASLFSIPRTLAEVSDAFLFDLTLEASLQFEGGAFVSLE